MRRLFVDKIEQNVIITGDDHEHLSRVLRARVGDKMILCPQDGYDYVSEITEISKTQTRFRIAEKRKNELEPKIEVTFYIAVPKTDKLEFAAQKLTELGVKRIVPFISRYVSAKPESVRVERLNKIAAEAAKQCGRGIIPKVKNVIDFDGMVKETSGFPLVIFPYENAVEPDIKTYLCSVSFTDSVAVIIGSEGGFEESEVDKLKQIGAVPLTLGKRILRAETAYVTVMSALMYEAGELK